LSRKFLETEGPAWVAEGLISEEQRRKLLARYPPQAQALGLLPLLGSVLVGLSALSVVAANWQALPDVLRLALMLGSLVGSYAAGAYFLRRGNPDLGHGLIGLGLILFGASIILTSQIYQLVGYDVSGLVAWVVAGVALSYVYGSRLLVLLTVLIGAAVQTYCVQALGSFSYATALMVAGGMGYYWWRRPDAVSSTVFATGLLWQAGLLIVVLHAKITWFFVPAMLVYAAGDWQPSRAGGRALQGPPLVAAYLFMFGLATFGETDTYANVLRPPLLPYLGALGAVLALSVAGKRARGRLIPCSTGSCSCRGSTCRAGCRWLWPRWWCYMHTPARCWPAPTGRKTPTNSPLGPSYSWQLPWWPTSSSPGLFWISPCFSCWVACCS
jgi:uncharacterized membrane protein